MREPPDAYSMHAKCTQHRVDDHTPHRSNAIRSWPLAISPLLSTGPSGSDRLFELWAARSAQRSSRRVLAAMPCARAAPTRFLLSPHPTPPPSPHHFSYVQRPLADPAFTPRVPCTPYVQRPLNASHSSFKKQLAIEQRHLSRSTKQRMTWRSIVQPGAASWEESAIFPLLPQFPSVDVRSGVAKRGQPEEYAIVVAYREFRSYSTNLVGVHDRRLQKPGIVDKPWPRPSCGEDL